MSGKEVPTFKTIPKGTSVTWHYRSAIGHGTVVELAVAEGDSINEDDLIARIE